MSASVIRHLAYDLDGSVPLDLTIQTVLSGHHVNLGKKMKLSPSESWAFWFWRDHCIGAAEIAMISYRTQDTIQVWTERMQSLVAWQRMGVAAHGSKSRRGGAYL